MESSFEMPIFKQIVNKCSSSQALTDTDLKIIITELIRQTQSNSEDKHKRNKIIENFNKEIEKVDKKVEELYELCINEQKENHLKMNNMYHELKRAHVNETMKVQSDLKHFLSQVEVEMNILDEFCYLTAHRFERQVNEEFSKIYSILQHKSEYFHSQTYHLPIEHLKNVDAISESHKSVEKKQEKKNKKNNFHSFCERDFGTVKKSVKSALKREKKLNLLHQEIKQKYTCSRDWFNSSCFHLENILFEENQITATNSEANIFLFGAEPLKENFTFDIRFESIGFCVSIGIGDISYAHIAKIDELCLNLLEYTNDAYLYAGGCHIKKEGKGFKIGEKVSIHGSLKTGVIKFTVGEEVRCCFQWEELLNSSIKWVPYVVFDSNDSASIFGLSH